MSRSSLPIPSSIRPPLIESMVESVSAANADHVVNDSKVISSVGRGIVWKWSNSQIDSNPSRSDWRARPPVHLAAYEPSVGCR